MKNFFPALALVFAFAISGFAQTPRPTATPKPTEANEDVVRISTSLIQIDVTVTDKNGKIVTDLKPEDFEVYENKEKQNITNFSFVSTGAEAEPAPPASKEKSPTSAVLPPATLRPEQVRRTVALVVDDLTLSFESVYYVRRALKKFVDEQMQDGDLVAIIRTGGGIGALQQFTSDRRQLYAAIEKVRWNPAGNGKVGAFAPIESSPLERMRAEGAQVSDEQLENERNLNQRNADFQGSLFATGTLGALNYIVNGMRELPGRKSIMLMSDGFKLTVKDESGFDEGSRILESLRRLTDLANRASVVIYTMDARGLQTVGMTAADSTSELTSEDIEGRMSDRRNELFDTQQGLTYLAQQTGGTSIINNNDLSSGIRKMLAAQKGYYLLGYEPDDETFDPKTRRFNRLNIKVNRPGLKVRYRSGFFGITDEAMPAATSAAAAKKTPAQRITEALTSPFSANGVNLRLNALYGNDPKNGAYVRSLLYVDAKDMKFTDEPDGSHKLIFDVLAMSFGDNGLAVDRIAKTYTLTVRAEAYQKILEEGFVYSFLFPVKKPGAYQLRVAIFDHGTEKVGSANQFIEAPNLKKNRLTISGLVLKNLTQKEYESFITNAGASSDNTDSTTMELDTSLRRFKRGTVLRYGGEIYNAKTSGTQAPQLTSQTRVFRDGKLLFEGKPVPVIVTGQNTAQKVIVNGAMNLGSEMPPGDYILQVVVTDALAKGKNQIATQFVQFEVVD